MSRRETGSRPASRRPKVRRRGEFWSLFLRRTGDCDVGNVPHAFVLTEGVTVYRIGRAFGHPNASSFYEVIFMRRRTQCLRTLGRRALVLAAIIANAAFAQAQEPATREAATEQAQADKSTKLHPYVTTKA